MSWTRGSLAALAVCVLLLTGSAGCGSSDAPAPGDGRSATASPSPVGKVLEHTDPEGRHYREVDGKEAPQVGLEVEPDAHGGWDVRLKVRDFRFSPAGTKPGAVSGRGIARLFVDDRPVADLRAPSHRIPAGYLPHGTHQVTARLYADDGTVWAVDGKPVQATADITASETEATAGTPSGTASPRAQSPSAPAPSALSAPDASSRTHGRGSPDRGGKAS
jgi:hypothetical protein